MANLTKLMNGLILIRSAEMRYVCGGKSFRTYDKALRYATHQFLENGIILGIEVK